MFQRAWHKAFLECISNSYGSFKGTFHNSLGIVFFHYCNGFLHSGSNPPEPTYSVIKDGKRSLICKARLKDTLKVIVI
ncbi:hypothetical protein QTP88_024174 [Uroleucon formosanum]